MRSKLLTKNGANKIQKIAESDCRKRVEEDIIRPAVRLIGGELLRKHSDRAAPLSRPGKGPAARLLTKPD